MKFPSWLELTQKITQFEEYVSEKRIEFNSEINKFKGDHPLVDEIIQRAIPLLPSPFNGIAGVIYDSFEGSKIEKSDSIINYFTYLKSQGENHYNKIISKLNNIEIDLEEIKSSTAKESTLQHIQDILISNGNITIQKLDDLRNETIVIHNKLDRMQSNMEKPIEKLGAAFGHFKGDEWEDWRFRGAFLERCDEIQLDERLINMIITIALDDFHWINRQKATNLLGRNSVKFPFIKETLQTIAENDKDRRIRKDAENWINGNPSEDQLEELSMKNKNQNISSKLSNMWKES